MARYKCLIIGKGIVGTNIGALYEKIGDVVYKDVENYFVLEKYDVMHVCIPYSKRFVKDVKNYIDKFKPKLTIVHSTVMPGTCNKLGVVFSPVIGDHNNMANSLKTMVKIVVSKDYKLAKKAQDSLKKVGIKTLILDDVEGVELGKMLLTSQFGVNIAFMQEAERMYRKIKSPLKTYLTMQKIYNDGYSKLRPNVRLPILYPGVIEGTCVMQNIAKLLTMFKCNLLRAVQKSNWRKKYDFSNNNYS